MRDIDGMDMDPHHGINYFDPTFFFFSSFFVHLKGMENAIYYSVGGVPFARKKFQCV